ncbi:MAG TPA: EscU/YscU/HrcU family type III secretion system export apparatus switch protein, partial [Devosia sp.]
MSDEAPENDAKTEDPSQKKLEDAFKKGDVVKSQEVVTWFMLLGSALVFATMAPGMAQNLVISLRSIMANADQVQLGGAGYMPFFNGLALTMVGTVTVPLLVLSACAVIANLVQHRFLVSVEPITPKFSKVSPLAGFKRLFSMESLVNFGKGLIKIAVVSVVLFFVVWPER